MRVALVHDYLNQYGGAERVLETFHELYPDAPVFTSLFDPDVLPRFYQSWDIRTSFLQRLPFARRHHRGFLLLYPMAFESFDLRDYDVVISNSSAWAKGVLTLPSTLHLSYCLTPMRWAWSLSEYVERERLDGAVKRILPFAMHYLRLWDVATAQRVDRFVGISRVVVDRIAKYYRRSADLIPPPVDVQKIPLGDTVDPSFLVVSRLVPYKRVDLAVEACSRLGIPLKVVGDGRDRTRLEGSAGPTVQFLGRLSDQEVHRELGRCQAFLFPGEEDFGIAPVEAMAAGRPVIAYAAGGALDTVVEGVSGAFFSPQSSPALCATLSAFDSKRFDRSAIRQHALQYDTQTFKERFRDHVAAAYQEHCKAHVASRTIAPQIVGSV